MKTKLSIQNLKCGGCAHTIMNKVSAVNNMSQVRVNVETSEVIFEAINIDAVNEVITVLSSIGYPMLDAKNNVVKKAKSYVSCAIGKMTK